MRVLGLIFFAWRNVWRQPRRSILTILGIGFSCAVLVFFRAVQLSSYSTSIRASTSIFHGHLQIQRAGYQEKPQITSTFTPQEAGVAALPTFGLIKDFSTRASAFALASSGERTYGVQVTGVVPGQERKVSTIPGTIQQGEYLADGDVQEAVIGSTLAKNLKIGVGGELTLLGQGKDGSVAATVLTVKGIFMSGSPEVDRSTLQMPLSTFQETYSMPGEIHSVVIATHDLDRVAEVQRALHHHLRNNPRLAALSWDELLPGLRQSIELDYTTSWFYFLSLGIIVGFLVLNTFLMSVLERTREFGVMLALGAKPALIARLILLESLLLTIFALACGVVLGCCVVVYFGVYGFAVPGSEELMKMWNLPAVLYPRLSWDVIWGGAGFILLIALLAVAYPALRIFRLEAVKAMHAV